MEEQFKDTENADSASPPYPEKKTGSLFTALVLSLIPVVYLSLVIYTEGMLFFISIFLFPIILLVLTAPIIGMIMGLTFLCGRKGNTAEKVIAASAVALPVLAVVFAIVYYSRPTTSLVFSM